LQNIFQSITSVFKIKIDNKRSFGLDILRAFAIMTILIAHSKILLTDLIPKKILRAITFDGVSIFFVLSGFLIGGILIKTIEKNGAHFSTLLNFWIRRWLRTVPMYFIVLTLLIVLAGLNVGPAESGNPILYYFFLQNFNTPHPLFFPEAWSLSIEEWFYLISPVLILVTIRFIKIDLKKSILFTAVLIIIFSTCFRFYRYSTIEINSIVNFADYIINQVVTRLDSLMYGVIGAYIQYYHKDLWIKHKKIMFLTAMLYFLSIKYIFSLHNGFDLFYCVFNYSIFSIAILFTLPFLSGLKVRKENTLYRIITTISLISYSMYLVNFVLVLGILVPKTMGFLHLHTGRATEACINMILFWLYTVLISILTYKYIEIPFMNLREKFNFRDNTTGK
jgi:peptidoglycan/LPS O-acetylase OafA/YrhL